MFFHDSESIECANVQTTMKIRAETFVSQKVFCICLVL